MFSVPSSHVSLSKLLLIALILGSAPAVGSAHDFWLEPSSFHPAVGEMVSVALRVGQNFIGDPVPRSASLIDSFVVRDAKREWPVNGFENQDPAGLLRIERNGVAVVAYRSKANPLELTPAKFDESLKLEGLESIIALRAKRGESDKPDREHFFRNAKSLLRTGKGAVGPIAHVPGFRYDIVLESNPWSAEPLRVRVIADGKPATGALITAVHRDDANARVSVRSDAKGRATLKLPKGGVWLVKSVFMTEGPKGSGADWESLWASVTFER
jgi:uncharacterized GH25 family protein